MKKLLSLSILSLSMLVGVSAVEAKTSSAAELNNSANASYSNAAQPGRWNRRVRIVTRTRIVRVGYRRYRETIQTRILPNGRRTTRVISRVRIR